MAIHSTQFHLSSSKRNEMIEITDEIASALKDANGTHGVIHVFVPHTTAGVTINENADPDVVQDVLNRLAALAPQGLTTSTPKAMPTRISRQFSSARL